MFFLCSAADFISSEDRLLTEFRLCCQILTERWGVQVIFCGVVVSEKSLFSLSDAGYRVEYSMYTYVCMFVCM